MTLQDRGGILFCSHFLQFIHLDCPEIVFKINPEKSENLKAARAEEYLIAFMISNPDMCQYINSRLSPQELATEFNRRVYKLISEKIMSGSEVTLTSISQYFSEEELSYITAYVSTARSETFHREALDKCIRTLRNEHERLLTKNPNEMTEDEYRAYMNRIGKNKK